MPTVVTRKRKLSIDGCNNNAVAVEGGTCIKHVGNEIKSVKDGCNIEMCSIDGCKNNATARGENCQEHGGKRIRAPRKRCSQRGCKKRESMKLGNGLCQSCDPQYTADARPKCSIDGCDNNAASGGICRTHGGKRIFKMCGLDGCEKWAAVGGYCRRHRSPSLRESNMTTCYLDGCSENLVEGSGLCTKHKCSHNGCNCQSTTEGGKCVKHGGKMKSYRKKCSHEGCDNLSQKGGVCRSHDPTRKQKQKKSPVTNETSSAQEKNDRPKLHSRCSDRPRCSVDGCSRQVEAGGKCRNHGGKRIYKTCSREGCTSRADKGGMCYPHNRDPSKLKVISGKPKCLIDGCKNIALKEGKCNKHGGNYIRDTRNQCSHSGCKKKESKQLGNGLCLLHGMETCKPIGGESPIETSSVQEKNDRPKLHSRCSDRPRCSVDGCIRQVEAGGKCRNHGGKRMRIYKTCSFEGCTSRAEKGGLCYLHNHHSKPKAIHGKPKCSMDGCKNIALKEGKCNKHGGNYIRDTRQQCSHSGCKKKESKQLGNGLCLLHGDRCGKFKVRSRRSRNLLDD